MVWVVCTRKGATLVQQKAYLSQAGYFTPFGPHTNAMRLSLDTFETLASVRDEVHKYEVSLCRNTLYLDTLDLSVWLPSTSKNLCLLLLMIEILQIEILHDLICQNYRNYGGILYLGRVQNSLYEAYNSPDNEDPI